MSPVDVGGLDFGSKNDSGGFPEGGMGGRNGKSVLQLKKGAETGDATHAASRLRTLAAGRSRQVTAVVPGLTGKMRQNLGKPRTVEMRSPPRRSCREMEAGVE